MEHIAEQLAFRALELMREQIDEGIDIDGKRYKYSERTFYVPYSKKLLAKLGKSEEGKLYKIIRGKNGKLGILILGGYKAYKQKLAASMDFLIWSGEMLNALTIQIINKDSAKIAFNNKEAAERAYFLNVSGVGKSRKLWKFFGLTKDNIKIIDDEAKKYSDTFVQQNISMR
ncbi:MAG: hypothetical protein ABFD61_01090 [Chloroherpetonaceae bacterium]